MGHLHFNTRDPEAHRRFWTLLGAKPLKPLLANDVYQVPNALILVRKHDVSGGTVGSIVDHIGFRVADLDGMIEKCKQAGIRIVTPPETTARTHKSYVMGPDDVNVEFLADPEMKEPIAFHHVHFFTSSVEDMRAWYIQRFRAVAGKRDQFQVADIPGADLSFTLAKTPFSPTVGRALDHIGFEVHNLEAFCKDLEAAGIKLDRPYTKLPGSLAIAFLTDPWGTNIELTEGLTQW
jgi:catechol 2,3-dioxygenase-like lactoylglutathione lyase family enzyme